MTNSLDDLAYRLTKLERTNRRRSSQLEHSSLVDGALREFAADEEQVVAQYGKQYDGTSTAATLVSPAPPAPSDPVGIGAPGGIKVTWDGTFENSPTTVAPMDWKHTDVVVGPVGMDPIATPPMVTITSPRGGEVFIALEPGDYEVALVTRTLAGRASEPSTVVAVTGAVLVGAEQFDQALEDELIATRVAGRLGEFLTVRANNLEASMALVTQLTSGGTGRRWEADPDGIRLYEADGTLIINFPTDPNSPASFYGDLFATSLTISDQLAIRGLVNEISKGSQLVVAGGTTAPTSPPSVTVDWESFVSTVNFDDTGSGFDKDRWGWSKHGAHFYTAQNLYGAGVTINRYSATDGGREFWGFNLASTMWVASSSVMAGNVIYVLGRNKNNDAYRVQGWNVDTQTKVADWAYPHFFGSSGPAHRTPRIAYDGTNIVIAFTNYADNRIQWRKYAPTTGVQQGATVVGTATFGTEIGAFWIGQGDFGTERAIVGVSGGCYVLTSAGAYLADQTFPCPVSVPSGISFSDGVFHSFDGPGARWYKHTSTTWGAESPVWWVSNTWYDGDSNGGMHETAQSPSKGFTMRKRSRLTITTGVVPVRSIPPHEDDAKAARVYIGRGTSNPGRTYMERVATLADADRLLIVDGLTLPAGVATSPPPSISNFPASSPGRVVSADETSWILSGDGSFTLGPITRSPLGVISIAGEGWVAPGLQNSWVNFGSGRSAAGYRKLLNGSVELRGSIKSGAVGTVCIQLPAGFRPTADESFVVQSDSGVALVDVEATLGYVRVTAYASGGSGASVSLSGISFDTLG